MATPTKILVVDSSPDLLELSRILLTAEGYEVVTSNYEEATLAAIKSHAPDVILFDLVKDRHEPWPLLEALREDPQARDMGVMVTSATASLIERALGNPALGVSNGLLMPFDIDDLYARLKEAVNHARPTPPDTPVPSPNPAVLAIAKLLHDEQRNLLFRWVQRISTLDAYRVRPNLDLEDVIGEMGALLESMISTLGYHDHAEPGGAPHDRNVLIARHVALRKAQGVSLPDICREYHMLREETSLLLRRSLRLWSLGMDDVLLAHQRVDEVTDYLVILSLETYHSPHPSSLSCEGIS